MTHSLHRYAEVSARSPKFWATFGAKKSRPPWRVEPNEMRQSCWVFDWEQNWYRHPGVNSMPGLTYGAPKSGSRSIFKKFTKGLWARVPKETKSLRTQAWGGGTHRLMVLLKALTNGYLLVKVRPPTSCASSVSFVHHGSCGVVAANVREISLDRLPQHHKNHFEN